MPGLTLSNNVPPIKLPFSYPCNFRFLPSTTKSAPAFSPSPIKVVILSNDSFVTIGPISASGSSHGPTFNELTLGAIFSINLSPTSPTATATLIAIQRSPAEPYAAPIKASTA